MSFVTFFRPQNNLAILRSEKLLILGLLPQLKIHESVGRDHLSKHSVWLGFSECGHSPHYVCIKSLQPHDKLLFYSIVMGDYCHVFP